MRSKESRGPYMTDEEMKKLYLALRKSAPRGWEANGNERGGYAIAETEETALNATLRTCHRLALLRSRKPTPWNMRQFERVCERIAQGANCTPDEVKQAIAIHAERACKEEPRCAECEAAPLCAYPKRRPTIKQLPETERPRERFIRGEELTEAELLAIIIRDGTQNESAIELGRRLIARFGDLRTMSTMSVDDLCQVDGIGPAKATQILAAFKLAERMARLSMPEGAQFNNSRAVFERFNPRMRDMKQEMFYSLLLDNKLRLMKEVTISRGGLSSSAVQPRDVFRPAIREGAAAVIFVHNHPSGDPQPSHDDIAVTRRLKEIGAEIGFRVLDHIIIGENSYYSFADEGQM